MHYQYKKFLLFFFLFAMILFGPKSLYAQSFREDQINNFTKKGYLSDEKFTLPDQPTLADYEKAVLLQNPKIKSAYAIWQSSLAKIAVAKGLPDPRINFGYFIQNIETAVGPQEYKIGISQTIPWIGKLKLQGDIQALKAEAEFQKLQATINDVLYKLKVTYYDYYLQLRSIEITKQNLDLVKNWEKVVLTKYATDTARHMDLIKTQIESIKLQDDLETLNAGLLPILENFKSLLNGEDITTVHIADTLEYNLETIDKESLKALVHKNNPDLKQIQKMESASAVAVKRQKLNYLPDFMFGVDFIGTGDKWNATGAPVPESGKDPLVIIGSINIPLWWFKQSGQIKSAKHTHHQLKEMVINKNNQLNTEFEKIWFELDDARRKVKLYRDHLLPKSLESLRASEKAYVSDNSDFLTLIDAQRRHLQFLLVYEGSLVRYLQAWAKLEKLQGGNNG